MLAICSLTLRRLREPASILLLLIGCLFAYAVKGAGFLELDAIQLVQEQGAETSGTKILLGTALLTSVGLLVTVFNAASEIPRDVSTRMVAILLSKPISRLEYVFGKFLGSLGIGMTNAGLWLTVMLVCRHFFATGRDVAALSPEALFSQYTCLLVLVPITAVAICFSCWFSDVVSMIVTTAYLLAAAAITILPIIASLSGEIFGKIIFMFYLLFPNMAFFLQSYDAVWGHLGILIYAFCVSCLFLFAGTARFGTGDVF